MEPKLLEPIVCIVCNGGFGTERKWSIGNKYQRNDFTIVDAINAVLFSIDNIISAIDEKGQERKICLSCVKEICKAYKPFNDLKSRIHKDSHVHSKLKAEQPTPSPKRMVVYPKLVTPDKKKVAQMMDSSKKRAVFCNQIRKILSDEVKELSTNENLTRIRRDRDGYMASNPQFRNEMKYFAPVTLACIEGMLEGKKKNYTFTSEMRSVVGISMKSRNLFANGFQKAVGLTLFLGKASVETYARLAKLGLSVSYPTIQKTLEKLCEGYDAKLVDFTQKLAKKINDEAIDPPTPQPGPSRKLDFDPQSLDDGILYGGMFTTDNINHTIFTLHATRAKGPKILNMTSNAFVFNRIGMKKEQFLGQRKFQKSSQCPLEAFLPTANDDEMIRNDHKILIKRTLVKYVQRYKSIQNHESVNWYIRHNYSGESSKKSEIVPLGILDLNQATTNGTKEVLKFLGKYIPNCGNRKLPMLVGGDALSVKMIVNSKYHLSNSGPNDEKLDGICPALGQFHLRMHLLHDQKRLFFSKSDGSSRGTLQFFRYYFNHPQKLQDIKHNFLLATRFFKFVTVAYIIAAMCDITGVTNDQLTEEFKDVPDEDKLRELETVVDKIFAMEWMDVYKVASQSRFCLCNTEHDSTRLYIACDNNYCKHHLWYHVDCLNNQTVYNKPPELSKIKKAEYYCSKECKFSCRDKKMLYSLSVINAGLMMMGYHDSIRTNDGFRMNAYNKYHMVQFNNYRHRVYFKYMIFTQAMKQGWAAPNVQFDLLHNVTVNLTGKKNSNLELDLFHEMMNKLLKDIMQTHRGNPTDASITRKSNALAVTKELMDNYYKLLSSYEDNDEQTQHHAVYDKWTQDLPEAVKVICEDKLLKNLSGRYHKGFSKFRNDLFHVGDITEYKEKIKNSVTFIDTAEYFYEEMFEDI